MSQAVILVSIVLRVVALGWSVALIRRFHDRRLLLLAAVLALMAVRQTLTLWLGAGAATDAAAAVAELPGLLVSLGMLVAVVLIGRMIDDYRVAVRAAESAGHSLEENETRLRFVIDQAPLVLWALDAEGTFTLSEGSGLAALGLEPGQVVGSTVFEVYADHPEILKHARRALAGHSVRSSVTVGDVVFETRQHPLLDSSGAVTGVIGVATDVTDRESAMRDLERSHAELAEAYDATLEGWVRALDLRDRDTEGHTQRVTHITVDLAQRLGVPDAELEHVRRGALLHDIGKIGIPDSVLKKRGPLDAAEWELMRQHPTWAHEMISAVPFLEPALDIPYCHHERWDGEGYPRGLAGEAIPLAARAFAVVDVWDALCSDRPYSAAWSEERALVYVRSEAGGHFDPAVVDAFLALLAER